jgi:polar amino acid transport system substrate-binding protein
MKYINFKVLTAAAVIAASTVTTAFAGPLYDRIKNNEPIRIGFANEKPFDYPGPNGEPEGIGNTFSLAVLKRMGYTNIQAVVTDFGSLIPGLQAGRFDIITASMNILKARCANVVFSDPFGKIGDGLIVAKGNPKKLENYADVAAKDAVLVTGAGYSNVQSAKDAGIKNLMIVPGPTEILAAVKAGRADAGALPYFTAKTLAQSAADSVEVPPASAMPNSTANWVSIAFRKEDADFAAAFNTAQKPYLGSPEMMEALKGYGYDEGWLPGDKTAEWVCANR